MATRRNPFKQNPVDDSKMKTSIEYAKKRAKETGRAYIVSDMGHAVMDDSHNRKAFKNMGVQIAYRVRVKK